MKTTARNRAGLLASLILALLHNASGTLRAEGQPHGIPHKTTVTAHGDFSIVPPNLGPYVIAGTDGDLYVQGLPSVGRFNPAGKGVALEGQGSASEVNLVATGMVSLAGRGPYAGSELELTFEEIGPGDSNIFNFRGYLTAAPRR